jgi:hypothetical protein
MGRVCLALLIGSLVILIALYLHIISDQDMRHIGLL